MNVSPSSVCVCIVYHHTHLCAFFKMCVLAHLSCFSHQTLREEKASHEKDMSNMRARSEEEASQMKESQARALEEVAKKHRLTLENALTNAELDKNRLLAVSTHTRTTHTHRFMDSKVRPIEKADVGPSWLIPS